MSNPLTKEEFAKKYEKILKDLRKIEKTTTALVDEIKHPDTVKFISTYKKQLNRIIDSTISNIGLLEDSVEHIKSHSLSYCIDCNTDLDLTFKFCYECGGRSKLHSEESDNEIN